MFTLNASAFPSLSTGSAIAQQFYNVMSPGVGAIGVSVILTMTPSFGELDFTYAPGSAVNGGLDFGTSSDFGTVTGGVMGNDVPEPATVFTAAAALAFLLLRQRRAL
jgi:hypothetical protein